MSGIDVQICGTLIGVPSENTDRDFFVRLWTICGVERILSEKRNNPKGLCVGLNQLRSVLSELVGLLGDRCSVFAGDEYLFILVEDRKRLGDFCV